MDDEIRMDNQVEWLCYDLISEGLLTAEQCHEVVQLFEQDGEYPELEIFARAVIDNGLFTDAERMKALVDSTPCRRLWWAHGSRACSDTSWFRPECYR